MYKRKLHVGAFLGIFIALLLVTNVGFAASDITPSQFQTNVMTFGSDIDYGTSFTTEFRKIFSGMNTVFKSIITILTVAAAAMLVFGIEDGKKTMWQFMLGIGLAYNFGSALWELFSGTGIFMSVDQVIATHQGTNASAEILKNSNANGNDDILTEIMAVYSGTIVNNGAPVLQAIALRMTIALAAIEGGYKIAMELYSGDKVKFVVATAFKVGFYCFLISEWLAIGQAMSGFFQAAGFLAAGESGFGTADPTTTDNNTTFRPDSIWHNATAFLELALHGKADGNNPGFGFWDAVEETGMLALAGGLLTGGPGAIIGPIVTILFVLFIVGLMIFISVEMFIARIEFYTMLMLSIVFLPFGVTERLAFLSNSAISLVFNSGAKMMVICFLQVMIAKIMSSYLMKLTANPFKDFAILCQIAIMCAFFAYVTKKIPELVSSFLNGSPALSGGGMMQQAKSMAATTAAVAGAGVGAVAGTAGAAKAMSTMSEAKGLKKISAMPKAAGAMLSPGNLASAGWNLAKTGAAVGLTSNPIARGFAQGAKAVVGSDGTMANKSFANKVQDLAGLTDQGHTSIFSRAAEKAALKKDTTPPPPPPPPPPLRDSSTFSKMPSGLSGNKRPSGLNTYIANKDDYKKNSGSGGGGKSESTDRQQPHPIVNGANAGSKTVNSFSTTINQQVQNTHNQQMNNINNTNVGGSGDKGSKDKK